MEIIFKMDETEKIIAKIKDVISNCDVINCTCVSGEETPHDRFINVVGRVIIELQKFISKNTEDDVLIAFHNDDGTNFIQSVFVDETCLKNLVGGD